MDIESFKKNLIFYLLGIIPVAWLALLAAPPTMDNGLIGIITGLTKPLSSLSTCTGRKNSFKTILIFLAAYALGIQIFFSTRKNYRRGEEHGSARWGEARSICKKYRDKTFEENKLLTQNVRIGLDGYKHRRNLNTLVCGGERGRKNPVLCRAQRHAGQHQHGHSGPQGRDYKSHRPSAGGQGLCGAHPGFNQHGEKPLLHSLCLPEHRQ